MGTGTFIGYLSVSFIGTDTFMALMGTGTFIKVAYHSKLWFYLGYLSV
jgi:hypothetical protein